MMIYQENRLSSIFCTSKLFQVDFQIEFTFFRIKLFQMTWKYLESECFQILPSHSKWLPNENQQGFGSSTHGSCINSIVSCVHRVASCVNSVVSCVHTVISCIHATLSCLNLSYHAWFLTVFSYILSSGFPFFVSASCVYLSYAFLRKFQAFLDYNLSTSIVP